MKALLAAAATATAVLLTSGCAASMPSAAASSQEAAIADVKVSVDGAITAAKSYGQKHLGHYLELDAKALRAEGYAPSSDVTITVYVDHLDVCVTAESTGLPAGAEWATAAATTDRPEAVAGGSCSVAESLKQFTVGG